MEREGRRHGEGKGRSFARLALDLDVPVHQLEIFFHDAQAQTDAVVFAVVAVLDLLELIVGVVGSGLYF